VASSVRPVPSADPARPSAWRRALLVCAAALLVVGSVSAQAVGLTPVAILLLIAAIVLVAPFALPALPS
jgi:hypothetical protein